MSDQFQPAVTSSVEVERVLTDFEKVELGQWYWTECRSWETSERESVLMCVMEIGSNFVVMNEPEMRGNRLKRVHRDKFCDELIFEPNADHHIQLKVLKLQNELAENMATIQRLTESLGIAPQIAHRPSGDVEGKSLALLSSQVDVGAFKSALIVAKETTLPALFKMNTKIADELARWMGAPSMPMKAKLGPMKESVEKIEDRLFSLQLYAGIFEKIFTLSDGEPAARDEKLRIFQRRLYCDEESLLDYASGGMVFDSMGDFDKWLAKPKNRDRILPFPRCAVSMRVRREEKDRHGLGLSAYVQFNEAQADKYTYLIVRNGEQLYRVCTDLDFGELMFPEKATFDPSEPMMMKVWGRDTIESMITKREFDARVTKSNENLAKLEQWDSENPKDKWEKENPNKDWHSSNPHRYCDRFGGQDWEPFDDTSVYFDLGMRKIQSEIKEFNRIALVIQGLFDRTSTLIPHNPVKMWVASSFAASVELVYDGSMALHWGSTPDIQQYIESCNAQTTAGSVMYGQERVWMEKEAVKENNRQANNWRIPDSQKYEYKLLRPQGDSGPGSVAFMANWKPRSKVATFTWARMRLRDSNDNPMVKAQVTAPLDRLFNISAYKLGDFKRFFADPRTRAQYLSWAPMLLCAEEYHNGKITPQRPLVE